MGSERPYLRPEWSDLGSVRPDLGSKRPYLESKGLHLQFGRSVLRLRGGGEVRKTETGEYCPMWNHRSSAPPGSLPKNGQPC